MDISQLSTASTAIGTLSNLILVSPQKTVGYQPQKFPSFIKDTSKPDDAFLFHYEGEQAMTLTSEITDHFTEENSAVNDQIALRPETFSTQGFIGELNDVVPAALAPLKIVAEKLTIIDGYTPALSATALKAFNDAALAYSVAANAASSALKSLDALAGTDGNTVINGTTVAAAKTRDQNKQQIAFQKFYKFWKDKTLFTIQTPWAVFQDMAIQTIHVVQDPESEVISQFDITFKIMRFATTQELDASGNVVVSPDSSQGRASGHAAVEQDLGSQTLAPSISTFDPSAA